MRRLWASGVALLCVGLLYAATVQAEVDPCPGTEAWLASTDLSGGSGVGGTGLTGGDDSGVGGTGNSDTGSGIGGTGLEGAGGTGIFGTVSGFGSVCVNGLRVHFDEDVRVEVNGHPTATDGLAIGQVVWIEAIFRNGRLETDRIAVHSAVLGEVRRLHRRLRLLEIAGQRVEVPYAARLAGADGFAALNPGDLLDVSGLRRPDGVIVASRVVRRSTPVERELIGPRLEDLLERAGPLRRLSVEGYVIERVADLRLRIGSLLVEIPRERAEALRVERGTRVRAMGRLAADRRLVVELRPERPQLERPGPLGPREIDRPVRPDRIERPERIDRLERFEVPVRPERIDAPTKEIR